MFFRMYVTPQNKSKQIYEDRNYIEHFFWLQHYETIGIIYRNKNEKKHKQVETKKHATKKPPMFQSGTQRGNQKIPWDSENKNYLKSMGYSENCSKREVYRNTCLPQETRKVSNKQPERKRTNRAQ